MDASEKLMNKLKINLCNKCKFLDNFHCTRTELKFPAEKSDPACSEFRPKK